VVPGVSVLGGGVLTGGGAADVSVAVTLAVAASSPSFGSPAHAVNARAKARAAHTELGCDALSLAQVLRGHDRVRMMLILVDASYCLPLPAAPGRASLRVEAQDPAVVVTHVHLAGGVFSETTHVHGQAQLLRTV
jgi:hypothetical protein